MTESQAAVRWKKAVKKNTLAASSTRNMMKVLEEDYDSMVQQARSSVGHGGLEGAFPEEWSVQLLFQAHDSKDGHKVVIFCPYFLLPVSENSDEMDRALRYALMHMDDIINEEEDFIFIYCYLGSDWSNPAVAARLRFAYENLPDVYREKLVKFYILNKSWNFQLTMLSFRMMLSSEFWNKIEYVDGLANLCKLIHPDDEEECEELQRKFPFLVHFKDAELQGVQLAGSVGMPGLVPGMVGMPLQTLSKRFGVDFFDRTTGKSYPRLPSPVIFLCEALERQGGDTDFNIDEVSAEDQRKILEVVNQGEPLQQDVQPRVHWFALKYFLESLPSPLLSYEAMGELSRATWSNKDTKKQKEFLVDLLNNQLPEECAYLALYVASFLHTILGNSLQRCGNTDLGGEVRKCLSKGADGRFREEEELHPLTLAELSRVFSPSFMRPSYATEKMGNTLTKDKTAALIEAFITYAEEAELWIGKPPSTDHFGKFESSSDEDEAGR